MEDEDFRAGAQVLLVLTVIPAIFVWLYTDTVFGFCLAAAAVLSSIRVNKIATTRYTSGCGILQFAALCVTSYCLSLTLVFLPLFGFLCANPTAGGPRRVAPLGIAFGVLIGAWIAAWVYYKLWSDA